MAGDLVGLAALISCILVAFTARKQGGHDILARCLVVRERAVFETADPDREEEDR